MIRKVTKIVILYVLLIILGTITLSYKQWILYSEEALIFICTDFVISIINILAVYNLSNYLNDSLSSHTKNIFIRFLLILSIVYLTQLLYHIAIVYFSLFSMGANELRPYIVFLRSHLSLDMLVENFYIFSLPYDKIASFIVQTLVSFIYFLTNACVVTVPLYVVIKNLHINYDQRKLLTSKLIDDKKVTYINLNEIIKVIKYINVEIFSNDRYRVVCSKICISDSALKEFISSLFMILFLLQLLDQQNDMFNVIIILSVILGYYFLYILIVDIFWGCDPEISVVTYDVFEECKIKTKFVSTVNGSLDILRMYTKSESQGNSILKNLSFIFACILITTLVYFVPTSIARYNTNYLVLIGYTVISVSLIIYQGMKKEDLYCKYFGIKHFILTAILMVVIFAV